MSLSRRAFAWAALLLAVAFAVSPFLTADFGGFDPNQFPVPQENPPVQPAGYAFAIWTVIYLWLIAGLGWGAFRKPRDAGWHAMRVPLCLSLLVGTFWLAVALAGPVWASVLIWIMLLSALAALFRAPPGDRWGAALPVGLYAGWLSAASCVSIGLLAAGYGIMSEQTAGLVFVGMAIVIGAGVQSPLRRAPSYGIAVIWALIAVVVQNLAGNPTVAALAAGGALALMLPTWRAARTG